MKVLYLRDEKFDAEVNVYFNEINFNYNIQIERISDCSAFECEIPCTEYPKNGIMGKEDALACLDIIKNISEDLDL